MPGRPAQPTRSVVLNGLNHGARVGIVVAAGLVEEPDEHLVEHDVVRDGYAVDRPELLGEALGQGAAPLDQLGSSSASPQLIDSATASAGWP